MIAATAFAHDAADPSDPLISGLVKRYEKLLGWGPDDSDYDGDGNSDLAVTFPLAGTVGVIRCNGDNTCQSPVEYDAGTQPVAASHGDFNSDGKTDLVVADASGSVVYLFLNKGDGTFQKGVTFATGIAPNWIAVGDFDGDSKDDIAVANATGNSVSVLLGTETERSRPKWITRLRYLPIR